MCGQQDSQMLYFESCHGNLFSRIKAKQAKKALFVERELWYLVFSIASALNYMETNQVPHSYITPKSILLMKEQISVKKPMEE